MNRQILKTYEPHELINFIGQSVVLIYRSTDDYFNAGIYLSGKVVNNPNSLLGDANTGYDVVLDVEPKNKENLNLVGFINKKTLNFLMRKQP